MSGLVGSTPTIISSRLFNLITRHKEFLSLPVKPFVVGSSPTSPFFGD